ncbi:sortase [Candidatus Daviesbacteria bacterium]|nr:sortase [Candidatus Daviesbacteria bacterium]
MVIKIFSLICLSIGIFILVQIIMPLIAFKFWEFSNYWQSKALIDPQKGEVAGVSIQNIGNFPAFISDSKERSYTYDRFFLTINKINLKDILVKVDTNSFEENLAHLPGSALPGEKGNIFITGHSSLVQLYKPGNFQAIFAKLPELKIGDNIELYVSGQKFEYVTLQIKIVDPKDISVINPPDKVGRYLTLMTCVPPGFNTKRLVVLAKLK